MSDDEDVREMFAEIDRARAESAERWIETLGLEGEDAEAFRRHSAHYILRDGEPVAVGLLEWAEWIEGADRIVAQDDVKAPDGHTYQVSTVFLGLDHSFGSSREPLLFETMIFRRHRTRAYRFGPFVIEADREALDYQYRYATLEQAQAGHRGAVADVKEGIFERAAADEPS